IGIAGAQNGEAPPPPDGQPDISGTWIGKLKVKAWDQHASDDDKSRARLPVLIEITQNGEKITLALNFFTDVGPRRFVLTGEVGNGHFWASMNEAAGVMMMSGHVKKNRLKGKAVVAEDFTVVEVKYSVKRGAGEALEHVAVTPSGSADGDPSIAGSWAGKHKWKAWYQYVPTDDSSRVGKGKDGIGVSVLQDGGNVHLTYVVDGGDAVPLSGEHGNGHFWAIGDHPRGGPMMMVGHVKKGRIKGVGVTVFDGALFEFKYKLRQ
ncbi:MAG: hypothetical protein ACYS99_11965, partial [Planctomycetota bacterium]